MGFSYFVIGFAAMFVGYMFGCIERKGELETLELSVQMLRDKNKELVACSHEMEAHLLNQIYLIYTGTGDILKVYRERMKVNSEN